MENTLGDGYYPSLDPFGHELKEAARVRLAGQPIAGDYKAVCDGIQADQDFIRVLFRPERSLGNTFVVWLILLKLLFVHSPMVVQKKYEKVLV